ncbi:MAG: hypothetical protein COA34_003535 [Methylophaga sp.]|uniref:hypothetical protein n=1 Tax=Methylophaga sp. TaxID=2024840 RepID=UPI000C0D5289|nr:hypothetical protein [Methylophaga sp.]MBL1456922.1 hypothetical protein [Methylophaga sp.]
MTDQLEINKPQQQFAIAMTAMERKALHLFQKLSESNKKVVLDLFKQQKSHAELEALYEKVYKP